MLRWPGCGMVSRNRTSRPRRRQWRFGMVVVGVLKEGSYSYARTTTAGHEGPGAEQGLHGLSFLNAIADCYSTTVSWPA
ncbi:hypothetical protein BU24DRAFT_274928 [Aaosphaeria arxii CBS 175.79]|uniref:Uncharacterized protein n=1 Tax=Aaosphaeria arxii CBS 175.79 TaxID=1450172 RepID=A0A6A5XGW7_9PLEO|nr:uncharacterized protein BU24DRAFT_274928 [Aaosphaeria arxii CBS 175.79]KAF2012332.1 hypothetical protein BU24DRAFT_274928 [Aaosphaeria arxii CBS 175.79]